MSKFLNRPDVQWLIFAACSASIFAAFWFTSRLDENKEDATSASENETEEVVRCLPPGAVTTNSFFGYRFGSELSNVDAIICKISRLGGGVEPVSSQTVSGLPTGLDKLRLHYSAKSRRLYRISSQKTYIGKDGTKGRMIADAEILVSMFTNAFPNSVEYSKRFRPEISTRNLYASAKVGQMEMNICIYNYTTSHWLDFEVSEPALMAVAHKEYLEVHKTDEHGMPVHGAGYNIVGAFFSMFLLSILVGIGFAVSLAVVTITQNICCSFIDRNFDFHFRWPDLISLFLPPLIWCFVQQFGNGKSLSNLVELPLLGAACGVCYGIRVFLGFLYPKITNFFWSVLTIPLMLAVAILWALYFPTLPE